MKLQDAVLICAAALTVGFLTACGAGKNSNEGFMTWDEMNQEYQQTATSFPFSLPEGFTFPENVRQPSDSQTHLYTSGGGRIQAY